MTRAAAAARELRAAVSLLTRAPVRGGDECTAGATAFPIVGAAIGVVGLTPILVVGDPSPVLATLLALVATTVLTGAMHLDALADTSDAILAFGSEAAERARRDPRIGTGGAVALGLVVALEVAALVQLLAVLGSWATWLIGSLACAASRTVPVVVGAWSGHSAAQTGSGAWFVSRTGARSALFATGVLLLVAATLGLASAVARPQFAPLLFGAAVVTFVLGCALGRFVILLRGQLDGDGLGAGVEIAFAAGLVAAALAAAGAPHR